MFPAIQISAAYSARLSNRTLAAVLCTMLTLAFAPGIADAAASARPAATVRPLQQIAVLLSRHRAYASPALSAPQVEWISATRPITAAPTALPVAGQFVAGDGTHWLHVMLPGRPNGRTGWVLQGGTKELFTSWHIVASRARREIRVFRQGRLARTFRAVVGKPSTPTPPGAFFVEETVQLRAGDAGGPYALALSARSDVLQEFAGGPGQIAIHGRNNLAGRLGSAASHGCLRLDAKAISWLAARIRPGVPVDISG